jgi:ABC-type branched-subunit amino acid transport system substrate-binding protein
MKIAFARLGRRLSLFCLACYSALALTFIPSARAQEIKIGVVLDQSSLNADIGRDYLAGARTYFDYVNSQGGIGGRKLNLVVKDDDGEPAKAVAATRQLIESEKVDALFGFVGDDTLAAISADPTFRNAKIALYAPLSGADLPVKSEQIFYARPSYRDEARYTINHFSQLGNRRFAIISATTGFGEKLSAQITEELAARQLQMVGRLELRTDLRSLEELAKKTLALQPQVVIVAADSIAMAEFLRKFRALDKGVNVVGFSTVNHRTLIELAKPEFAVGTMLTQVVPHPDLPSTKVQSEHLALMKKFRDEPPSHVTLEGFIAAKGFVTAISRNTLTRQGILASLSGDKRTDVGGITLAFSQASGRGSSFVDLAFLRKSGRLVQ